MTQPGPLKVDQRIVVLGTGGTIAGVADDAGDAVGYRSAEVGVAALLSGLAPAGVVTEAEQVAQLDSKDMDAATWRTLALRAAHHAARAEVDGIVVTHGTDTLEETAWFLASMAGVADAGKPLVLTGAMRPSTARSPDGPQNLADALTVAASPGARGVLAVFAGTLYAARGLRKIHPHRLDAFAAADGAVQGRVEEGRVRLLRPWPDVSARIEPRCLPDAGRWPRVEIVTSAACADGRVVDLLVDDGVAGLVLAGCGNGSVHRALDAALQRAVARGVAVLRSTRCLEGTIVAGSAADSYDTTDLAPPQARVELMVRLLTVAAGPHPG